MDQDRIAELLAPFLGQNENVEPTLLSSISIYLDILLRWNARVNLTAVRDPDEIITRHFGESLFAACNILPPQSAGLRVIDVGSGAGFPGLAIKLWDQDIKLTMIESNHKKATFLREVVRTLELADCEVFAERANTFRGTGDVVTLRAVERFEEILPTAIRLVKPGGRIAVLISDSQKETAHSADPKIQWDSTIRIPQSDNRILMIGAQRLA